MKEMKGKVKKFYEDHKDGCRAVGIAGLVAAGEIIGWKLCCNAYGLKKGRNVITHDGFNHVINDAMKRYKATGCSTFYAYNDANDSLKLSELGKLADLCREAGYVNMDQELTHIVAFGKPIIEK